MALTNVWLAGYGGPAVGATAVWIAPNDGTVPAATQVTLVGWNGPVSGATPIWIAGYGGPPPAAIGAIPICIKGWSGSGGSGGGGGATSVWSAADAATNGMTLSNGGLTVTPSGVASWQSIRSSASKTAGKLYVEFSNIGAILAAHPQMIFGLASSGFAAGSYLGSSNYSYGIFLSGSDQMSAGFTQHYQSGLPETGAIGDVYGLAIDFATGNFWLAQNNVWSNSSSPAAGTLPLASFVPATVGALFAGMSFNGASTGVWTLQATAASQKYAPPSGFSAWDGGTAPPPTSVWSASDAAANGMTLSNGGLTAAATSGNHYTIRNTISKTSGKLYIEFLVVVGEPDDYGLWGVAASSFPITTYLGGAPTSAGIYNAGNTFVTTGFTANYVVTPAAVANDVIALAVDFGAGSIWIARNNVWLNSSNPATATLPIVSFVPATVGALFAGVSFGNSTWTLQSQPSQQKYLPPPGFQAWDGGPVTPPPSSVWSASDAAANSTTLSNGGLTATYNGVASLYHPVRTTVSKSSGKLYVEFLNVVSGNVDGYGFASASTNVSVALGNSNYSVDIGWNGNIVSAGFTSNYPVTLWANIGMVISLAIDFAAGSIWIALNGVWSGADPATGTAPIISFVPATVGALFPAIGWQGVGASYTLQATAASQKYAPPSGFSAWDSAAPTHSPQALAYLARTVGGNEGGNGTNIANLIDGLVADGVWAQLDCLYVLAQQNATDARLNLVSASYPLTGTPTFTAYQGFSGFSASALNTGFNDSTATSPNYTLNSASMGVWVYSLIDGTGVDIGSDTSTDNILISFSGTSYTRINGVNSNSIPAPAAGSKGLFGGDRPSSANVIPYWNGVAQTTQASGSAAVVNANFAIGNIGGNSVAHTLSGAFIGASLGSAGQLALYTRLRTYMTAVGVP